MFKGSGSKEVLSCGESGWGGVGSGDRWEGRLGRGRSGLGSSWLVWGEGRGEKEFWSE